MMYGYGPGGTTVYGMWPWILLFALIVLIIVIGVVVAVVRASRNPGAGTPGQPGVPGHDEAEQIAKRRLASGEITKEQYDEIIKTIHA